MRYIANADDTQLNKTIAELLLMLKNYQKLNHTKTDFVLYCIVFVHL